MPPSETLLLPTLCITALFAAGCTRPVPLGDDGGGRDAPAMDARVDAPSAEADTPRADALVDTGAMGSMDVPSLDAGSDTLADAPGTFDTAAPDARPDVPPDTGSSCDARFGSVPGYLLCSESATQCVFYSRSPGGGRNCRDLCEMFGASCLQEERTDGDCTGQGTTSCGNPEPEVICTCER